MKQTKIIATIGPASSEPQMIEKLINAGVNVFRLNFSHGDHATHKTNIENIRKIATKTSKPIAIMADLQGPKIRVSKFTQGKVELANGSFITLDTEYKDLGDENLVGVDYEHLAHDVKSGDTLLLDDGKLTFIVENVIGSKIKCKVIQGGTLKNNKGINKLGGGLTAPALTEKDFEDISFISTQKVDYVAISFPKAASDVQLAKLKLAELGASKVQIISKMERTEAVAENMNEIIKASDGIMVARGDLAVEVGEALVPGLQKKLVSLCRQHHKLSIVATQMLESMIENPVATRAEVSDIANAVLDGTDAVMLSAETASGKYPLQAVETMARVCAEAEKMADIDIEAKFVHEKFANKQQTIAMAALFSAYHLNCQAIVALTASGSIARWLSRVISGVPIYAVTDSHEAFQTMSMYRGVQPYFLKHKATDTTEHAREACAFLQHQQILHDGDTVVVTMGDKVANVGGTNALKVLTI